LRVHERPSTLPTSSLTEISRRHPARRLPCEKALMHRNNNATDVDWAQLVRAEYLEVPGLDLTRDQAQRLWGLDRTACEQLLAALVESRFLKRTRDNRYLLASSSV
jgi:hypothetical protein